MHSPRTSTTNPFLPPGKCPNGLIGPCASARKNELCAHGKRRGPKPVVLGTSALSRLRSRPGRDGKFRRRFRASRRRPATATATRVTDRRCARKCASWPPEYQNPLVASRSPQGTRCSSRPPVPEEHRPSPPKSQPRSGRRACGAFRPAKNSRLQKRPAFVGPSRTDRRRRGAMPRAALRGSCDQARANPTKRPGSIPGRRSGDSAGTTATGQTMHFTGS